MSKFECTIMLGIIFLCVGIFWAAAYAVKYDCKQKGKIMGFETYWSLSTDCMIKVKGQWVPLENYRAF